MLCNLISHDFCIRWQQWPSKNSRVLQSRTFVILSDSLSLTFNSVSARTVLLFTLNLLLCIFNMYDFTILQLHKKISALKVTLFFSSTKSPPKSAKLQMTRKNCASILSDTYQWLKVTLNFIKICQQPLQNVVVVVVVANDVSVY